MKRIVLSMFALCAMMCATAQVEDAKNAPKTAGIEQLQLAKQLAIYGYDNGSPTALIEAARIMSGVQFDGLEAQVTRSEGQDVESPNGDRKMTAATLIADAKKLAGDDKQILALADGVIIAGAGTRGAVGGERGQNDVVYGRSYNDYVVAFKKGIIAQIGVSGNGNSDLDLYVYDENGNVIVADTDYSDDCYVSWYPRWTGNYLIRVVNQGTYRNYFTIVTN